MDLVRVGRLIMSPFFTKLLKKLLKVVTNATLATSICFSVPWGGCVCVVIVTRSD